MGQPAQDAELPLERWALCMPRTALQQRDLEVHVAIVHNVASSVDLAASGPALAHHKLVTAEEQISWPHHRRVAAGSPHMRHQGSDLHAGSGGCTSRTASLAVLGVLECDAFLANQRQERLNHAGVELRADATPELP